jgi:hypothetical protein
MTTNTTKCAHHWVIDAPDFDETPQSEGTCKKCHTIKRFDNTYNYSEWYGFNKTRPWTKDIAKSTKKQQRNTKGKFA